MNSNNIDIEFLEHNKSAEHQQDNPVEPDDEVLRIELPEDEQDEAGNEESPVAGAPDESPLLTDEPGSNSTDIAADSLSLTAPEDTLILPEEDSNALQSELEDLELSSDSISEDWEQTGELKPVGNTEPILEISDPIHVDSIELRNDENQGVDDVVIVPSSDSLSLTDNDIEELPETDLSVTLPDSDDDASPVSEPELSFSFGASPDTNDLSVVPEESDAENSALPIDLSTDLTLESEEVESIESTDMPDSDIKVNAEPDSGLSFESTPADAVQTPTPEAKTPTQESAKPTSLESFLQSKDFKKTKERIAKKQAKSKKKTGTAKKKRRRNLQISIPLSSLFENSQLLGLDVGTGSIKYVQIKKSSRGIRLQNCGNFEIPQVSVDAGVEEKDNNLIQTLQSNIHQKLLKNTLITTAVSGLEVFFKNIQVPKMSKKEMDKAVPWACRKDFPYPIETTQFEYEVISNSKNTDTPKSDVFVVAAKRDLIASHLGVLLKAKIKPAKVSTVPSALWSLFKTVVKKDTDKTHAIIDIGANASHIIFVADGRLLFAREISTGSDHFNEALVGDMFVNGKEVKVTFDQAEKIKIEHGIPMNAGENDVTSQGIPLQEVTVMMGSIVDRLANDMQRTIDFFHDKFRDNKPQKIWITGGGAMISNLEKVLSRDLNYPVEILNPFDVVSLKKFEGDKSIRKMGPRFAVSVGLALDRGKTLNLLPKVLKGSALFYIIKKLFRYVFVIAILGMALATQNLSKKFKAEEAAFDSLNKTYSAALPLREEFQALQKELQSLKNVQKDYDNSISVKLDAAQHLKVISHLIPKNVTLTTMQITFKSKLIEGQKQPAKQEIIILRGVVFEQNSMEGVTLATLLMEIEKTGYFKNIALKSQKILPDGSIDFAIECETYAVL